MTYLNNRTEKEHNCDDQYKEIIRLKELVKRQHYIIDYLENRLYCSLIDTDYNDPTK